MSQNLRNQPNEDQLSSGRGSNENQFRKRNEGFEGMNYEQRRPPYNPKHGSSSDRNDDNGNGKRRDEL